MATTYVHPFGHLSDDEVEYMEAVKAAFHATRYGWSDWEFSATVDAFWADPRPTPQQTASCLSTAYARRKADRSA